MKASGSHIVDFSNVSVSAANELGGPDDYLVEPWFSAGALRFLAVQVGGVHAVYDTLKDYLMRTKRANHPYQAHRLAKSALALETSYLWLEKLARTWIKAEETQSDANSDLLLAQVNGARFVIETLALDVLQEAEKAIGAAGFIAPHPFERQMRDLRTYLRQPNPDGALTKFSESIVNGCWRPGEKLMELMDAKTFDVEKVSGPVLVVAPHPDDETLGCGGLIAALCERNVIVHTLFVTDGGASHQNSVAYPRSTLVSLRQQEAIAALDRLGAGSQPRTLDHQDSAMSSRGSIAFNDAVMTASHLVTAVKPSHVVLPWRNDPHRDHQDSYAIFHEALKAVSATPQVLEYAIWLDEFGSSQDFPQTDEVTPVVLDITQYLEKKTRAIQEHHSQLGEVIVDDPKGFVLSKQTLARLIGPQEKYWLS